MEWMSLTNKNADKIWFSGTYHKVGIFLPLINAEEQKKKIKGSFILQLCSSKF